MKSHAGRRVGLDELAVEILRRHRAAVDALAEDLCVDVAEDAFIFSRSPSGIEPIMPTVVTHFVARVSKKVCVPMHAHQLRHFAATQAIGGGFDPVAVAGRLGHAYASVTLRVYSHALGQRDREMASALGKALALHR